MILSNPAPGTNSARQSSTAAQRNRANFVLSVVSCGPHLLAAEYRLLFMLMGSPLLLFLVERRLEKRNHQSSAYVTVEIIMLTGIVD